VGLVPFLSDVFDARARPVEKAATVHLMRADLNQPKGSRQYTFYVIRGFMYGEIGDSNRSDHTVMCLGPASKEDSLQADFHDFE